MTYIIHVSEIDCFVHSEKKSIHDHHDSNLPLCFGVVVVLNHRVVGNACSLKQNRNTMVIRCIGARNPVFFLKVENLVLKSEHDKGADSSTSMARPIDLKDALGISLKIEMFLCRE